MNNTQRKICAGAVSVFGVQHQLITAIERRKKHQDAGIVRTFASF